LADETYAAGLRDVLGEFRSRALLILDEAHHAAPAGGSRYAISSQFTKAVRDLAERFELNFSSSLIAAYAKEIAQDEQHHVEFLRSVLNKKAVARPKIDLQTSFTTAARAAGLISNTQTFDAFANDTNFLLAAYIFEDVGVTAYHGAAPVLDNKTYLDAAAGILAVEAYHAGLIRTVLFAEGKSTETQKISNLRQELGPVRSNFGTGKDSGVGTIAAPNIVLADSVSIAFDRTTRDVLNIVYGAQNAYKGLFFPAGLNGVIK
jgi:hypothetical protein